MAHRHIGTPLAVGAGLGALAITLATFGVPNATVVDTLVATVILVLTLIAWPIAAWRRRRRGTPLALSPNELSLYRVVRGVALIDVVFLAGWMGIVSAGNADLAA